MPLLSYQIDPGALRHSIVIQKPNPANRDAGGQIVDQWDNLLTTRAQIESTSSQSYRESFSSNSLAAQSTDCITLRWPGPGIILKPGMRVLFGDNTYLVQAVDNVQHRNHKIRLACLSIDSDSN
jgi:head-tail adaptor